MEIASPLGQDVPPWSGEFWTTEDQEFGYMSVAYEDERQHFPPEGWTYVNSIHDDEAQVYCFRRVGNKCPGCIDGEQGCLSSHST